MWVLLSPTRLIQLFTSRWIFILLRPHWFTQTLICLFDQRENKCIHCIHPPPTQTHTHANSKVSLLSGLAASYLWVVLSKLDSQLKLGADKDATFADSLFLSESSCKWTRKCTSTPILIFILVALQPLRHIQFKLRQTLQRALQVRNKSQGQQHGYDGWNVTEND